MSCCLQWSLRQLRSKLLLSKICAAESSQSASVTHKARDIHTQQATGCLWTIAYIEYPLYNVICHIIYIILIVHLLSHKSQKPQYDMHRSTSLSSFAPQAEGHVLHNCRCRLDFELDDVINGRLEVSPVSLSLKTEHMPLFIRPEPLDSSLRTESGAFPCIYGLIYAIFMIFYDDLWAYLGLSGRCETCFGDPRRIWQYLQALDQELATFGRFLCSRVAIP